LGKVTHQKKRKRQKR